MIGYPVLTVTKASPDDFVRYWDRAFGNYDEEFYRENVGRLPDENRAYEWFRWKNGKPLSARKMQTVRALLAEGSIGPGAEDGVLTSYLARPGGVVWRVFWLHILHPEHFPIYDQHVHRAMACILGWPNREIAAYGPTKARDYVLSYRPFFGRFEGCDRRQADRALWAFGKFLTTKYGRQLLPASN
jgi:hypothetical protein